MSVLRTIKCDVPGCEETYTEETPSAGWPGWGAINGVNWNGADNPNLCPIHLEQVMNWLDNNYMEPKDAVD